MNRPSPAPLRPVLVAAALASALAGCFGGSDETEAVIDRLRDASSGTPAGDAANTLAVGTPATGNLGPGDPTLDDGSHYDTWIFRGTEGERVAFLLDSDDFDAHLAVGTGSPSQLSMLGMDDDSGAGTNARVEIVVPRTGNFVVRANSLGSDESGAYTLRVERLGTDAGPETGAPTVTQGTLGDGDEIDEGGTAGDVVPFRGRAGQRVAVTVASTDFDPVVMLRRTTTTGMKTVQMNDDSGAGRNARLDVLLPADGEYEIVVFAFDGASGEYTLRVAASN